MKKEVTAVHTWQIDPVPSAATYWPQVVGLLRGYGYSRRANVQPMLHPHLVIKGSGTFTNAFGTFPITKGDLFLLWPEVPHEFCEDPDDPYDFFWMRIVGEDTDRLGREWGGSPEHPVLRTPHPDLAIRACEALFDYWGRQERDPYEGLALFHNFIAVSRRRTPSLAATDRSPRELVTEARTTAESLMETGINVNELARHLGINRSSLWRAFQQETGLGPVQYLHHMRIDRAKRLLVSSGLKVEAVARACGYRNEKYFYRRFRDLTDQTPGAWRRRA